MIFERIIMYFLYTPYSMYFRISVAPTRSPVVCSPWLILDPCVLQRSFRKFKVPLGFEHMGGSQNDGPLLGPLNIRCCIIARTQKGIIISTTTHMDLDVGLLASSGG